MNRATADIKDDFKNDSKVMQEAVDKVSKNVASLVEHLEETKAHAEPSVRPKEKKENEVENDKVEEPEVEIIEPKRRKGIFFTSSIRLQCNIQKLSHDLNSKIRLEKTLSH